MRLPLLALALALALVASGALAQKAPEDLPGSADHPVLQRFSGSRITGQSQQHWAQVQLPLSAKLTADGRSFAELQTLEGKVTRLHYLGPEGKAALEVFRNYQQALMGAGFQPRLRCESDCASLYRAWQAQKPLRQGMQWSPGTLPGTGLSHDDAPNDAEGRMLVGSLPGSGLQLLLYVSAASNTGGRYSSTFVQWVEPKAMQTGQVSVDAKALGQGLQAEGRIALYGLNFDSGKSDLRDDSQAQVEQMAALLKAQPALKVFVVGHTDNVGNFDANLALSQARAQAVVAALQRAGIAAARLRAQGAANIAPLASNATEPGRAKNRRVELVLQ